MESEECMGFDSLMTVPGSSVCPMAANLTISWTLKIRSSMPLLCRSTPLTDVTKVRELISGMHAVEQIRCPSGANLSKLFA
jgi:hypothetical protein